jgi:hypothetical protein
VDDAFELAEFDRFVEENRISEEEYPAAFARWIREHTDGASRPVEGPESQRSDGRGDPAM